MERGEAGEWAGQTGFAARPNERGRAEVGEWGLGRGLAGLPSRGWERVSLRGGGRVGPLGQNTEEEDFSFYFIFFYFKSNSKTFSKAI
jgi:hypothetical protein